ncbi:MAG: hypothetical protein H6707_02050 [Deltaproteobacteria bacterium]|nr:hypothetical protein [Deltaproteobacteria bacterium]
MSDRYEIRVEQVDEDAASVVLSVRALEADLEHPDALGFYVSVLATMYWIRKDDNGLAPFLARELQGSTRVAGPHPTMKLYEDYIEACEEEEPGAFANAHEQQFEHLFTLEHLGGGQMKVVASDARLLTHVTAGLCISTEFGPDGVWADW